MLRRLIVITLAIGAMVGAAACGQAAPKAQAPAQKPGKVLNIGFYGGNLGTEFQQSFVAPFEKKYNIKVNVVTAYDSVRFTQLAQNPSHPSLDVAFFTAPIMPKVLSSNIADTLSTKTIPNLSQVYPSLIWPGDKAVAFSFGAWGIVYNKTKIHQPITSWADLLNPAFKNKVTAPDIEFSSSILTLDAMARLGGGSIKNVNPGLKNMATLASHSQSLWQSPTSLVQWLQQGEVWISPYANGDTYALKDPNLAFVTPKEGAYLVPFYAVKVHNAANPVGAQMFINYILGAKTQSNWVRASYYSPANEHAVIPASYKNLVTTGPEVKKLIQIDWNYYNQNQSQITQEWQAQVK